MCQHYSVAGNFVGKSLGIIFSLLPANKFKPHFSSFFCTGVGSVTVQVSCWADLPELIIGVSSNHFPFHFVTYMLATPIFTQLLKKDVPLQRYMVILIHNYFRYGSTTEEEKDRGV